MSIVSKSDFFCSFWKVLIQRVVTLHIRFANLDIAIRSDEDEIFAKLPAKAFHITDKEATIGVAVNTPPVLPVVANKFTNVIILSRRFSVVL